MLRKTLSNVPFSRPYLIVTTVSVVIFFPTWFRLASLWLEFEQVLAHGLATAIIFVILLMIHPPVPSPESRPPRPWHNLAGILALLVITLVWALLELVRIDTLAFLMLPPGLLAVSWAVLGVQRTLSFLPYVLVLALSLPIWADIVPALVSLASVVVGAWVRWFGMTALIEGNSITLPYGRLLIADGCSGIRYFAISILLAMMTSILNDYRWKGWLITVALAAMIGLIANWVRITILVVVAYETNMQSSLLTDHETMGWIVFAAFIFPALYFSPVRKRSNQQRVRPLATPFRKRSLSAIVAAIAIGPLALLLSQHTTDPEPAWSLNLPEFRPSSAPGLPIPISLPDTLQQQVWHSGNLWVSFAQSQKQASEDKLVPYLPTLYDKSVWHTSDQMAPGVMLMRNILTREQVVMGQWYQVGPLRGWSYREAKLLQIPATLGGATRFALVTLQVPCGERACSEAMAELETTMEHIGNRLHSEG